MQIQPVSVFYTAPKGEHPALYGWWADMPFGRHFLTVLSRARQGRVDVIFHDPVAVDAFASRKDLAAYCEAVVRDGVAGLLTPSP